LREVGIYRKKFIIFLILACLVVGVYFLWHYFGKSQAAIQFADSPKYTTVSQTTMNVVVGSDGTVTVDGKKQNKALSFLKEYDEIRILVYDNPGEFISNFRATIQLPEGANKEDLRAIIYAVHGVGSNSAEVESPTTLIYEANNISPSATVTIVADFPKGLVTPGIFAQIIYFFFNLPVSIWLIVAIVLPLIAIVVMLFMIVARKSDQIFRPKGILAAPPENIPPAVAGVLIDGQVSAREVAATLIDLARRDFIFIVNKGSGQFSFGIKKAADFAEMPGLKPFEKALLSKVFLPRAYKSTVEDVDMRIGRHIFSRRMAEFYLHVYNMATEVGYFKKNPAKVHMAYKYTGIVLFFLSFAGFIIGSIIGIDPKFSLVFWVGGMTAAAAIIRLSGFMPARSQKGSEELKKWLSFREYLTDSKPAGADALQGKFEEYLAYAIVLGAEVEWVKRFVDEPFAKPAWYDSVERAITLENFATQLFPLISYVSDNLARSHEPTVE